MNRFVLLVVLLACCQAGRGCLAQAKDGAFAAEMKPRATPAKAPQRPSPENDDPFANGSASPSMSPRDLQVRHEEKAPEDPRSMLARGQFGCDSRRSGLVFSLRENEDFADIEVIYSPKTKQELRIAFLRDGKRLVEVRGHWQSLFRVFENKLYFVDYSSNQRGCAVVAYDLSNGKMLWRTPLRGAKGKETGIVECVNMSVHEWVSLSCQEANGKFRVVLDRATGAELAHRVYTGEETPQRGPPPGAAPPGMPPPAPGGTGTRQNLP